MSRVQHEMVRRVAAAQLVVDRYAGQPFAWGYADCGRTVGAVLKAMGNKISLASFGHYSSELGARRALKRRGFDSMEHFLDQYPLARIGHASVLPADLLGLQAVDAAGARADWLGIGVCLGNGRALAFIEGFGRVVQPRQIEAAWRVPCR